MRDLNFNLHQKNTELASTKTMVRLDGQDMEVAEERNSCRNQVHEMNIALKNSLERIKRLRAKAAKSSSGRQSMSLSRCTSP